jgi:hypothetical protein
MVPDVETVGGKRSTFLEQLMSSTFIWIIILASLFAGFYYYFYENIFKIKESIKKSVRDKLYSYLSNNQLSKDGVVLTVSKDSAYQSILTYLDSFLLAPSEYQEISFLDEDDESSDEEEEEEL